MVIETRRTIFFTNMVVGFQCGISWDVERDMNQLISDTCLNFRVFSMANMTKKGNPTFFVQFWFTEKSENTQSFDSIDGYIQFKDKTTWGET